MTTTDYPDLWLTPVACGVEAGIRWAVMKHKTLGHRCGYVKIPDGHRWSSLSYSRIASLVDDAAPGGITYAANQWIGFDTAHAGDYWPDAPKCSRVHKDFDLPWTVRWTEGKVIEQAQYLARFVAGPMEVAS